MVKYDIQDRHDKTRQTGQDRTRQYMQWKRQTPHFGQDRTGQDRTHNGQDRQHISEGTRQEKTVYTSDRTDSKFWTVQGRTNSTFRTGQSGQINRPDIQGRQTSITERQGRHDIQISAHRQADRQDMPSTQDILQEKADMEDRQ